MNKRTETAVIVVPEIRDYQRINLEIVVHLEEGYGKVELQGVERQRLLVSGLKGDWEGLIVVQGDAGPDLAANLDAPRLRVVCEGGAADGAGHSLKAGTLEIERNAGAGLGYGQTGGLIVVKGDCGPRAGLNQAGGTLMILGKSGCLAGERRKGGNLLGFRSSMGKPLDHGSQGGRFLALDEESIDDLPLDREACDHLKNLIAAKSGSGASPSRRSL